MSNDPMVVSLRTVQNTKGDEPEKKQTKKRKKGGILVYGAVAIVLIVAIFGGTYLAMSYSFIPNPFTNSVSNPELDGALFTERESSENAVSENLTADMANAEANVEIEDILLRVGKLIRLPQDEVPTVATVTKPEQLKDQDFFSKAKIGDKVLIYTKARKAYLYDPVDDILVEVAPITTETLP